MKLKMLALSVLLSGSALISFNAAAAEQATVNASAEMTQQDNKVAARDEKQILGIFVAINKNEINAAKIALKNTKNKDVDAFADMMEKSHTQNLDDVMKLSKDLKMKPTNSKISVAIKTEGKKQAEKLKALHNDAFDTAYMDAMVKGHEKALEVIDKALKDTSNNDVKSYLEATRKHVQEHLDLAKQTQSKMPGQVQQ